MSARSLSFALLFALGCAPSTPAPGGADGGTVLPGTDGGGSAGRFECCINDVGYRCPTEAALNQCAGGFDPECFSRCMTPDCFDACARMQAEAMPDPSGCTADATVTCESAGVCIRGSACDLDSDCASDNCTDGYCYDNGEGCACDLDSDCTSDNCTDGLCRGNGVGAPCELDSDCTSDNCTGGECQGNGFGSPCELDSDCTSDSCTDGTCS
jgi:hypothetical protein